MPDWVDEHAVMWRGSAHRVSLPDLLRLRSAGWVAEARDRPDLHLGLVHAVLEYDSPAAAARQLDEDAARRRERYQASRGPGVSGGRGTKEASGRATTTRARDAARTQRRRRGS